MSDGSKIEWTSGDDGTPGATWNPVTGCTKVSPGCDHCYAETFAERWRGVPGHHFENGFDVTLRPDRLGQPLRWQRPRRIFVNSMSDLFHDAVPDEYIVRVFDVMQTARRHTFQVLTKRHARMRSFVTRYLSGEFATEPLDTSPLAGTVDRPPQNIWLGVSAEDQKWFDIRVPALLETPAAVRFVSCEPLLGPVDLSRWLSPKVSKEFESYGLLDDQIGKYGLQERDGVGSPVDTPSAHRLPSMPGSPSVIPSDAAPTHGVSEPGDHLGRSAVDGDPDATSTFGALPNVQIPLSVEHAGNVAEHRGVGRHGDGCCSAGTSLPAAGNTPCVQSPPDGSPTDAVPRGEPVYSRAGLISRDDLFNLGDLAQRHTRYSPTIDWLIVGGESGSGARPMKLEWAREIVKQCGWSGIPPFVKQLGSVLGRELGAGPKGGDWDRWPEDLRVREFPRAAEAVPSCT